MTYGEERVLCACVSLMIFILAAGIFIGFKIPRIEKREPVKDEQWFMTEAAEIYTLAMEWYDPDNSPSDSLRKELRGKIRRYNREAGKIARWTYRCPPGFSFEYLGIKED